MQSMIGMGIFYGRKRGIVVARPGSCKVIAKRIKDICTQNNIQVHDVRGNNLLEEKELFYELSNTNSIYKK